MRAGALVGRNLKEAVRDPLSLGASILMPAALFVVFHLALRDVSEVFVASSLAPCMAVFGFAMLTLSAGMALAQDRETSLFTRLLTTPLRPNDFVAGYAIPYLIISVVQAAAIFGIGYAFDLGIAGSASLVALVLLLMAVWFIGVGIILGSLIPYKGVSGVWAPILVFTTLGGTWMDLDEIGGPLQSIGNGLPFAHAIDACRAVMVDGAGWSDIAGDVAWVAGYTLAAAAVALVVFRRRMQA